MGRRLTHTIFFIVIFTIGSISCNDNDDDSDLISFYSIEESSLKVDGVDISSKELGEKIVCVSIRGGSEPYIAKSSDQNIVEDASIYIEDFYGGAKNTLSLVPKKIGETIITITNSEKKPAVLKITISAATERYNIVSAKLLLNEEIKESIKSEINKDIEENNLLKDNSYILTYEHAISGSALIYSDTYAKNKRFEGSFKLEKIKDEENSELIYSLVMTYNGREHRYNRVSNRNPSLKATMLKNKFAEDLTEYYNEKYPNENITEVIYILETIHLH